MCSVHLVVISWNRQLCSQWLFVARRSSLLQQNYSSAMANLEAPPCERDPLLAAQRRDPNPNDNDGGPAPAVEVRESPLVNLVIWFFNFAFYCFCFLSGQYYVKTDTSVTSTWKAKARVVLSCLGLDMFVLQLCLCMGHVGLRIWMEDDRIENKTEVVNITSNCKHFNNTK